MADKVKFINGHEIKVMTRNEINNELIEKGDWGIEYMVPGRQLYPYFINVNRKRHRFKSLKDVENFCMTYDKDNLKRMSYNEIERIASKF